MHGTTENKPGLRAAFRSLLGALLASSPAIASSAADEPPMVLAKTGYFFVGGKIDASVPGSPVTGQMYVEYFIPKTLSHPLPIVQWGLRILEAPQPGQRTIMPHCHQSKATVGDSGVKVELISSSP